MSWFRRRRIDPSRAAFCRAAFTRAEPLEPRWLLAAPELVYDFNTNTAPSQPTPPVELNGAYYFTANDGVHGRELWRTDGTPAGTTMVKELIAGASATSGFSELYRAGNLIYFTAAGSLYRTDGTDPGTVALAPMSLISPVVDVEGTAYFGGSSSSTPGVGFELWKSDGTPAGTTLVKDIFPGIYPGTVNTAASSYPSHLVDFDGMLFFFAATADAGMELWKSDGTDAGTVLVKDIKPGAADSNKIAGLGYPPAYMTVLGDSLYFAADGPSGRELYRTDGTDAGTVLVKDINTVGDAAPAELTAANGAVLFAATDAVGGRELWRSDGTADGTARVADLAGGPNGSSPMYFAAAGDTLYFSAGSALWKSDGTGPGTVRVTTQTNANKIYTPIPGERQPPPQILDVSHGATDGPAVLFRSFGGLWVSDGTDAGTHPFPQTFAVPPATKPEVTLPDVSQPMAPDSAGRVWLPATTPETSIELFVADPATQTVRLTADVNRNTNDAGFRGNIALGDGTALVAAKDTVGWGLFRTDGTAGGTTLVKRVTPGFPDPHTPQETRFTRVGNTVYFIATDAAGTELWKTDGTEAGTLRVKDVLPGPDSSEPRELTAVGNTLYFRAATPDTGVEWWRSDGTEDGTRLVRDVRPGPDGSYGRDLYGNLLDGAAAYQGLLYFAADDGVHGARIWRTDGTDAGTVMLTDPADANGPFDPGHFTVSGGKLFFSANSHQIALPAGGESGIELWSTDGTPAGTALMKDIAPQFHALPQLLTDVNGTLYFMAAAANRYTLYRSDGTAAGTVPVTRADGDVLYTAALYPANGKLYFAAGNTGVNGFDDVEPWTTDPSRPDAVRLADVNPGFPSSVPTQFTAAGGRLFFTANSAATGNELWQTDGTAAGTTLVADLLPGNPAGPTSSVSGLTDLGDTLLFTARTPAYGAELMKLTLAPALVTVVGTLFNDRNVDGRRNAAEAALAGWQVRVRSGGETGPIVGTAVTDATGAYRVGDLAATDGPFFIQPDLPPGWTLTGPVAVIATVGPGSLVQADFSAVQGSVVFGTVYDDTNLDGTYQVRQAGHNDDPLPGWVVFADLDGNGIANGSDPVAITNTVGNYVLGPLPQRAQTYVIRTVASEPYRAVSVGDEARVLDLQTAQRLSGVNLGFTTLPVHGVVARQVFDGSTSDPATATPAANKFVLLPGEVAGFANVISTSRGLTLIGVDIVGLPDAALLRAEDFQAETLSADTLGWAPAPIQPTVVVQPGDGFRGSDRVLLTFPADAIRNTWLRVTALATPRTGLARPDVFYFGNLIGDTGPDGAAPAVDARDFAAVRRNLFSRDAAAVSRYDFNDDGVIDNADLTVVRANQGRRLPPLTAPPAEAPAPAIAQATPRRAARPGRRSILAEITALLLPVENVIIQK